LASFAAAQIEIDDVPIVVVLLDSSFGALALEQKQARHSVLRDCAAREGMAGSVAIVWQDQQGRTCFLAAPEQHAFFQIVSYPQWRAQVDRTLECA
jgi:hypothetical protein